MHPSLKAATVVSGLAGSAMITAATTSPSELDSNIAWWLTALGWENPPQALVSSNADIIVAAIGLALIAAAALGIWGWIASPRTKEPPHSQGEQSAFIRGKVKNLDLEKNYSSADSFVDAEVDSLVAKGNLHDPGGLRRTAWQRAQAWLTKDRG